MCDLQSSLDLGQSLLSHHLRVLRQARLGRSGTDGRWVHYALSDEALTMAEARISETRKKARAAALRGSRC